MLHVEMSGSGTIHFLSFLHAQKKNVIGFPLDTVGRYHTVKLWLVQYSLRSGLLYQGALPPFLSALPFHPVALLGAVSCLDLLRLF